MEYATIDTVQSNDALYIVIRKKWHFRIGPVVVGGVVLGASEVVTASCHIESFSPA